MNKVMNRFLKELFRVLPFILGLAIDQLAKTFGVDITDWRMISLMLVVFCMYLAVAVHIEKLDD